MRQPTVKSPIEASWAKRQDGSLDCKLMWGDKEVGNFSDAEERFVITATTADEAWDWLKAMDQCNDWPDAPWDHEFDEHDECLQPVFLRETTFALAHAWNQSFIEGLRILALKRAKHSLEVAR